MTPATFICNDNVDRARAYMAKVPGAVAGQNGHSETFAAAMRLVQDFALNRDDALLLMREWNGACSPAWTETELAHKVDDAIRHIDPAKLGSKAKANGHQTKRPALESWAAMRGFNPAAVAEMGGESSGDCVSFPMFLGGRQVGEHLRNADGSNFRIGGKTHTKAGGKLGLFLSKTMRAGAPADAERVSIAEGVPNAVSLVDAGERHVIGLPQAPGDSKSLAELQRLLAGYRGSVIFFADSGRAGAKLAERMRETLAGVGVDVLVVPGLPTADLDKRIQQERHRPMALANLIVEAKAIEQGARARTRPNTITAADLATLEIPPTRWIVPDLLAEGQAVLAGRPKSGKSWCALSLAADVAAGGHFLGRFPTNAGDVLYLALEDSLGRFHGRLGALLGEGVPMPARLHLATEWARLDRGGLDDIELWLLDHPETRLVIIDTLAKIKPPRNARGDAYEQDYLVGAGLQRLAIKNHVCIMCLMHTRKAESDDVFDTISGTLGQTAAADTIMVLKRKRGTNSGELHVTGRDINESAWSMEVSDSRWTVTGDVEESETSKRAKCAAWLVEYLQGGPKEGEQVLEDAKAAGFGKNLVWEMKKETGIRAKKSGMSGGWLWRLPTSHGGDASGAFGGKTGLIEEYRKPSDASKHPGEMPKTPTTTGMDEIPNSIGSPGEVSEASRLLDDEELF